MITTGQYLLACHLVDAHGAAERFETFCYPSKQGRRNLAPRTFLIGALLTILSKGSMRYNDIYTTLTSEIPPFAMVELGVAKEARREDGTRVARVCLTRDSLYNFTRKVRKACGSRGRSIEPATKAALLDIVNLVIAATLPSRPNGSSAYSVDETGVWAWSKGRKVPQEVKERPEYLEDDVTTHEFATPQGRRSVDPDGAWGRKTKKSGGTETFFGYSMHGMVRAPAMNSGYDSEPLLLEYFDLTPASTDLVRATLGMVDKMRAAGSEITELIVDRHYSFKSYERWAVELRKRGVRQVLDLRSEDCNGFVDADGTRVAAGVPHCPLTPEHLGHLKRPGPVESRPKALRGSNGEDHDVAEREEKLELFGQQIDLRAKFALERHGPGNGNPLDSRWGCPAAAGKVGCPLRPGTVEAATALGLPIVEGAADITPLPKVCSQATVTLKYEDVQPKLQQEHYWGSEKWEVSYARRSRVEGFFGTLKDASVGNLCRDAFRGDCLGLRLLHVGLSSAITNLCLVRKWHLNTGKRLDMPDVLLANFDPPTEFLLEDPAA